MEDVMIRYRPFTVNNIADFQVPPEVVWVDWGESKEKYGQENKILRGRQEVLLDKAVKGFEWQGSFPYQLKFPVNVSVRGVVPERLSAALAWFIHKSGQGKGRWKTQNIRIM